MAEMYLIGMVLMGLVLVAIIASAMRSDRFDASVIESPPWQDDDESGGLTSRPTVWRAGLLLLAFGLGGALIGTAAGPELVGDDAAGTFGFLVGGLLAGVVAMVVFSGTYTVLRNRGFGQAPATAAVAWVAGIILIATITFHLIENL